MPDTDIDIASTEDALFSRVPLLENRRMSSYLEYRSCGFSIREACNLAEISPSTLYKWRRESPEFADFESNRLYELQKNLGPDIQRLMFLRNYLMVMKVDFKVLWKASLTPPEQLPEDIKDLYKTIRKHYTPQDMLALHKALEPDKREETSAIPQVVVIVDNQIVTDEAARQAAAQSLLRDFTVNEKLAVVEGEVVEDGDGESAT